VVVLVYSLTGFRMVTVAPGTTDPEGSVTVPVMVPELVPDSALTIEVVNEKRTANKKKRMLRE
jgi:hypothetical protein